jgi:DNA-binding SARP family transcriptional activator/tetratricopeptide (TPR) repeat protein
MKPMLRVRVLGGLVIEGVDRAALGSRKQRRLLARLTVAQGAALSVDELAEDLWGDDQPASPRDQISVLVSRLRQALPAGSLSRHDAGYALATDWSDLAALTERSSEAARRAADTQWAAAAEAARAALALLRGPVLPELADTDWVVVEQESVSRTAQQVRLLLAQAELAVGDPRLAADAAREALTASPYDEIALRLHLDACLAARSPAVGLATYAAFRGRLVDELGVDPTAESRAAYERLLHAAGDEATGNADEPEVSEAPAGRSRELALVLRAVDRAAGGAGAFLVLTGEPGIGKTRVLQAVAATSHHPVVRVKCDELGRVLPLQPILDGLAAELRLRTPDQLHQLLAEDSGLLGPLLGLELAVSGPGLPDGGTGQLLLQAAVVRLLERLAGDDALVLLVDDAHLADAATLALLTGLPRRASRVAAVLAARSGAGPTWPAEAVIEIGALDLAAVTEVVGAARADLLFARSGGHPLLLQELAAHDDMAASGDKSTTLLDKLRTAFGAAADSAGRAGATLRAASVVGPDLDLDVLSQVLQRPAVELLDDLEEGVRRRLLIEQTSGFAFRHALVREALAADVGPTRTALLHRETARALQARGGGDPLVLAHHARAGGLLDVAAAAFATAAGIASARYAHAEAASLAEQALHADPELPVAALHRARALLALGRYRDAAAAADTAVRRGAGAAALQVGALAAHYQRDWELATELADQAAGAAGDEASRATALAVGGHARHAAGDVAGAEARFTTAGALGGAHSGWLAILRHHQGRSEQTLTLTAEANDSSSGLDEMALPLVQMSRGLALAALGRPADALRCFEVMDDVVERLSISRYAGRADNCRGHVLRNLGLLAQADDYNIAARETGVRIEVDEPVAHALLDLAEGKLRAGDLAETTRLLDEAAVYAGVERRHGFQWRQQLRASWLRGRVALAAGENDIAGQHAEDVIREARLREAARYESFGQVLALHVRTASGSPPTPTQALRAIDALGATAGMEQLWLTVELASLAKGRLREALRSRATDVGSNLIDNSPQDLKPHVRRHVATLLD